MENQHRHISGCRDLAQAEIDLINEIKARGNEFGELVARMREMTGQHGMVTQIGTLDLDQRWIAIGSTHLQQGIMALVRAVAKPDGF